MIPLSINHQIHQVCNHTCVHCWATFNDVAICPFTLVFCAEGSPADVGLDEGTDVARRLRDLTTNLQAHGEWIRQHRNRLQDAKSLEELKEENKALQELVDGAEIQLEQLIMDHKRELAEVKEKRFRAQRSPHISPQRIAPVDKTSQAYRDIIGALVSDTSANLETYLRLIGTCFADRVVILPSAFKSARKANQFQQSPRAFRLMLRLVTDYLDEYVQGGDVRAREVFSREEYSANVSNTTRNNRNTVGRYTFTHEGETHTYEQHLCIGKRSGTRQTWRLYFRVDQQRIVIAHCGEHLPT